MITNVEKIRDEVINILKNHDVKRAAFFGSLARGEQTASSDIDILVEFKGKKSLLDLVELQLDIEDALGIHADVLTYNSLLPAIKERVLKEQIPII
jgi:predicted nucleotidyltransferase